VKVPDWGLPFDDDPAAKDTAVAVAGKFGYGSARPDPGASQLVGWDAAASEWPRQFARLLTEALAGARPVRQIMPLTSGRARAHLGRLMPLFGGGQRLRLLRVITTRPTWEVIEMTVIVGVGARTRALAIRLEQATPQRPGTPIARATRDDVATAGQLRWVCTDIEAA
jgi:hypothetical protein